MKKKHFLLILLIICLCILFPSCKKEEKKIYTGEDFDAYMNEIFLAEVQSDSITLNYTIAHPENYGIKNFKPTFGTYSEKNMKESNELTKKYIKKLNQFDYKTLSPEQKKTYDILYKYLNDHLMNKKCYLYNEILSPTTGLQAQLPVLLAEYHFYKKKDLVDYIALLNNMDDYFKQIIEFQKSKSKEGLFMSDTSVDAVVAQCKSFISTKENNYLITLFNEKIDSYTALTPTEKENFKAQNKQAVLTCVIPAYQNLIKQLTALKGTGKNNGGLCNLKYGKDYYKYLVRNTTCSDRSMKNINSLLDSNITKGIAAMSYILQQDKDMEKKLTTYYYPLTDPNEILTFLQSAIKEDFPPLENTNCNIKYVDKSLEDYLSPAFYLTPQLDNYKDNCIYINRNKKYNLDEIFTTIAHEGYPGHLYQNCYYNQQSPPDIRHILNFEGYSEGWATYVELYSYSISGLDENISELLMQNQIVTLCIYAKCDLNINYYGWDLKATKAYLKKFGFDDEKVAKTIYANMVEEPCSYLKYTLGYLEMYQLREKAEKKLGSQFDAQEFHKFILDMGPCQFDILNKYLDEWLNK